MSTSDNNDYQCGDSEEMKSSKKECTSCEQNDVNNITKGIDSIAIQDDISTCAACGKEGNSDNMNTCNKCKMVKYCNAACKKKHRHKHKKQCNEHLRLAAERAAKLHDEKLFEQPPIKDGDCPICFLRMPTPDTGSKYQTCCGKLICSGCFFAPVYDNQGNKVDSEKCPFCRTADPKSNEEIIKRIKKRVEMNDSIATYNLGICYRDGRHGLPQDITKALELWYRAGELGYAEAYRDIGYAYDTGRRGLEVDKKKANHYYELAAMAGDAAARHNLGVNEVLFAGNIDRALKHLMIAVSGGVSLSLDMIKKMYSNGDATKEYYTKALQSYQAYLGEIKSKQRDEAAAANELKYRYY